MQFQPQKKTALFRDISNGFFFHPSTGSRPTNSPSQYWTGIFQANICQLVIFPAIFKYLYKKIIFYPNGFNIIMFDFPVSILSKPLSFIMAENSCYSRIKKIPLITWTNFNGLNFCQVVDHSAVYRPTVFQLSPQLVCSVHF